MLSWLGSRCWTMTKAMPVGGRARASISRRASSPPAEAPIPTTGPAKGGAVTVPAPSRISEASPPGALWKSWCIEIRERELGLRDRGDRVGDRHQRALDDEPTLRKRRGQPAQGPA